MKKKNVAGVLVGSALATFATVALAATTVTINAIDEKGVGKSLGTITVEDSKDGLVLTAKLKGVPAGEHGFHVHEDGSCNPKEKDGMMVAGLAAGGHYDPAKSGKHAGPKGQGHLGDLPPLAADKDDNVDVKLVAPRLKVADLNGHALVIHEGGDNFSDNPKPLGGGGARIACGVVK